MDKIYLRAYLVKDRTTSAPGVGPSVRNLGVECVSYDKGRFGSPRASSRQAKFNDHTRP